MDREFPDGQTDGGIRHRCELPDLDSSRQLSFVILVADNDVLIRNLVTLLMQLDGYAVLSAADGQEGLELSHQFPGMIDLLITDMHMPGMNGSELYACLLRNRPGIKVLMMSGEDMVEIATQNANLPFLPKPFDGQLLRARVRALLSQPLHTAMHRLRSDLRI